MTSLYLPELPSHDGSPRGVGDVPTGEDNARPLLQACSFGDDTALRSLLSQPQWIRTILEKPITIWTNLDGEPRPILNIERCLIVAAVNGHAAILYTLLAFAKEQNIASDDTTFMSRQLINNAIRSGNPAVIKALASANPAVVNFPLWHGARPLGEAVRFRVFEVAAVLLELGARISDPDLYGWSYRNIPLYRAVFCDARMVEMLIEHGSPVAGTAALHIAGLYGKLDMMRLLLKHGADVNEALDNWHERTPMHLAAQKGQLEAMKLLEEYGARSDVKDTNGKTPAQLLDESKVAKS